MSGESPYYWKLIKMISVKFLRGSLSMNQSQVSSVGNITVSRLAAAANGDKESKNLSPIYVQLSTSSHLSQPAPLLTPKTPKASADLRQAEADLPSRPKKPITPWIAFIRDKKDNHLKEKQGMKASELAVILAKEWRMANKSLYEQEYREEHAKYRRAIESYENSLTDEQRAVIKLRKNLKRETKAAKKLRGTKPPVLPRHSANMYCVERCKDPDIKEQMKTKKSAHVMRDLFAEYRKLSDSEKEKYLELQQRDKLRFQQEFTQWYDGIQSDSTLPRAVYDKANDLHARFKALNWI